MIWMWAVCILAHKRRSLADCRRRRVGEGMEEVVRLEQYSLRLLIAMRFALSARNRTVGWYLSSALGLGLDLRLLLWRGLMDAPSTRRLFG